VVLRDVDKLGGVLQHGENGSLDVDHPGGIFVVGAHRFHGTILPGEEERSFLQFASINLFFETADGGLSELEDGVARGTESN